MHMCAHLASIDLPLALHENELVPDGGGPPRHRARARPQALSKSKLVFISMNVNYEYSGKFDWGRKPRAPARVQHVLLHAPRAGGVATPRSRLQIGQNRTKRVNIFAPRPLRNGWLAGVLDLGLARAPRNVFRLAARLFRGRPEYGGAKHNHCVWLLVYPDTITYVICVTTWLS